MNVLIAENEMAVSRLLGVLMKREGHESQVVEDGTEALEVARREVPDLLVMDAVLPGISGQELLEELRASDETAGIPLIVLGTQEELDEFGTNGFATLTKPFALPELRAALERAVESGVTAAR